MEKTKSTQIVTLPTTNERRGNYISLYNGIMDYKPFNKLQQGEIPLHIYLISDDEIKEGDKVIYSYESGDQEYKAIGTITKMSGKYPKEIDNIIPITTITCPIKVIASTDRYLGLPFIPEKWIYTKYIPSNGTIEKLLLEMEIDLDKQGEIDMHQSVIQIPGMKYDDVIAYKLKLTNVNEVVIIEEPIDRKNSKILSQKNSTTHTHIDHELEKTARAFATRSDGLFYHKDYIAFKSGSEWEKQRKK